jgi:hypothetical protein
MIADPTRPLSAEEATRNRRIIVAIAVVFVIVSVAVFAWGLTVTQASRDTAKRTDAALRSVAWALLCHAQANGGMFPITDGGLAEPAAGATLAAGKPWPSTRESALGGLEPVALADARQVVGITWGTTPDVVPNLNTKGNPSGKGTEAAVNGWLAEYARDRVRTGSPASPTAPQRSTAP